MSSTRKRLEALTAGLVLPEAARERPEERSSLNSPEVPPPAAAGVETRFPPAVGGSMLPRTGPGQMMAFRGQIQQVEGEMNALRAKLSHYEGSMPTRKIDPKRIRPSRWANRHEAAFSNSEFAGLKADIEQAGGNVQPILVRPIAGEADQYEIVFGHRRHRASLELGIPVLTSIWTEELGDAALFAAMDRENRERADLSTYEQGLMYQRALDEQLFPTQRQLAEALGVSHTWVRKALTVAQLPTPIVECFRNPLEISFRHAEQINVAIEKDRRGVLKRAEKVRGNAMAPALVVGRLTDAKATFERTEKIDVVIGDQKVGHLTRTKSGEISISLSAESASADADAVGAAVLVALRKARVG